MVKRATTITSAVLLAVMALPTTASASQLPGEDDDATDRVLEYPSGLSADFTEDYTLAQVARSEVRTAGYMTFASYGSATPPDPNTYSRPDITAADRVTWRSRTHVGWTGGDIGPCDITASVYTEMRCDRGWIEFNFSAPVTDPVLHINNLGGWAYQDYGQDPNYTSAYSWKTAVSILTLDTENSDFSGNADIVMESAFGNFDVVSDGADYLLTNADSRLDGAPAITRAEGNPIVGHVYAPGGYGSGSVVVTGTWTKLRLNRDLLWQFGPFDSTLDASSGRTFDENDAGNVERSALNLCVLSQIPAAQIFECTGSGTSWNIGSTDITSQAYYLIREDTWVPESIDLVITVDEDFGTAPSSYDAGDGASHVISDIAIGAAASSTGDELTNDNSGASGIVSPNAGASDADDDAFETPPMLPETGDYTVTIPVSGVSATAKVCGWIDADASGTFEEAEKACADVTTGDESASLTWPESLVSSIVADTWMRLRVSYDTTGVASPIGRVNSGEVEDWRLRPYTPPETTTTTAAPTTSATPTTTAPTTTPTTDDPSDGMGAPTSVDPAESELPATGNSRQLVPTALALTMAGALVAMSRRRVTRP